jgi:hypothetical protein
MTVYCELRMCFCVFGSAAEEALGMRYVFVLRHVQAALEVEDRASDGREAQAVAARAPLLNPSSNHFRCSTPSCGLATGSDTRLQIDGRPVRAASSRATWRVALVPPSAPGATWITPVPSSPSTLASAKCLAAFDNRRVTTVDLDRVRDHVAAARERLAAANIGYCQLYEALKPVVGSHDRIDQAGSKGKSSRWLDEDVIDINVFLRRRPQA